MPVTLGQLTKYIMPAHAKRRSSFEIISGPGIGKSETVATWPAIMSKITGEPWGFADLFLATQTPPDLIGYQFKGEVMWDGKKYSITDPTMPTWFMTKDGKPLFAYKRGVLFLDEYGQGQTDVKTTSAELLLNGRIGPWRIPDGWLVVAASNRMRDRSGVTKSLDFVINRRTEYHVRPDMDEFVAWCLTHDVPATVIHFAKEYPHVVFSEEVPKEQGPWCTPRSVVRTARVIAELGLDAGDPLVYEVASGDIGQAATAQYIASLKLGQDVPSYEEIIANPAKVKMPSKPDGQMLVCFSLAQKAKVEHADEIITYVDRMQKEFTVTFAKAVCTRDQAFVETDAFTKWAVDNSALVSAIVRPSR